MICSQRRQGSRNPKQTYTCMRSCLSHQAFAIASAGALVLPTARAADADVEELKSLFQEQIKRLEKRISTLEADNARLKRQVAVAPAPKSSTEIASLKKRVTELELGDGKPSAEAVATSKRAAENA